MRRNSSPFHIVATAISFACLAPLASAQETYWISGTGGLKEVSTCGHVLQTVGVTSTNTPGVAPDGKIWALGSTISVRNPNGTLFKNVVPAPSMTPYSIAFDKAGHAWVTSSSGLMSVEEFDAAGNSLGVHTLAVDQARDISVDSAGNKWIAHRVGPPGSISRIDAVTKAITNHPLPATSRILPIVVYPDARGLLNPSHIWVVGDNRGAGEVVEFDINGNHLNSYVLSSGARLNGLTADVDAMGVTRNVWTCDYSTGEVYKVDAAMGTWTKYALSAGVFDVSTDGFGNVWATLTRNGELQRLDPATGNVEVVVSFGAAEGLSTRWQFATVVDQLGDLDGDGAVNLLDAAGGASPFDGCSTPGASLSIEGSTKVGAMSAIRVLGAAGVPTALGFAGGVVAPGLSLPGVGCSLRLDPLSLAPITVVVPGTVTIPITIPNNPGLVGSVFYMQGLQAGTAPTFTNVACMLFY